MIFKKNLKLGTKINLIVFTIILLLSIPLGIIGYSEIKNGIKDFAIEKAKGDLNLAYRYIDSQYPGEWKIQDEKLFKGDTLINDNNEIIDDIGEDTGDTVTIFQADNRVVTNVMKDGKRATGTSASQEVVEIVLNKSENFYGEANAAGNVYQTAYMPIKDNSNNVIGMFYVGAPQDVLDSIIVGFSTKFFSVLIIILLLTCLIIFLFSNRIKKRINHIVLALEVAGNGDFTTTLNDRIGDEISDLSRYYNLMTAKLREMFEKVVTTTELVTTSSEELTVNAEETSRATETITNSIVQVSDGAEKSTHAIQQSADSLQEISKGVYHMAENASSITEISTHAMDLSTNGGKLVNETVIQMNEIHQSVLESMKNLNLLVSRSVEIGSISDSISGIAEQTNLLSLNAAIEAARAGEHGKGFSVVASEVRKLAEQSQLSAEQISMIISKIQKEMTSSTQSMHKVTERVKTGLDIVSQTEGNFKEVVDFMKVISERIHEIAAVAQEVSSGLDEISQSVVTLSNFALETSENSQNVAASAEEQLASMEEISHSSMALSKIADELQELISQFKIGSKN